MFIALPVLLVATVLTALVTTIGSTIGSAHFWGYYPAMIWSRLMCWGMLLPVKVIGREKLQKNTSYVFVANGYNELIPFNNVLRGYYSQYYSYYL